MRAISLILLIGLLAVSSCFRSQAPTTIEYPEKWPGFITLPAGSQPVRISGIAPDLDGKFSSVEEIGSGDTAGYTIYIGFRYSGTLQQLEAELVQQVNDEFEFQPFSEMVLHSIVQNAGFSELHIADFERRISIRVFPLRTNSQALPDQYCIQVSYEIRDLTIE